MAAQICKPIIITGKRFFISFSFAAGGVGADYTYTKNLYPFYRLANLLLLQQWRKRLYRL